MLYGIEPPSPKETPALLDEIFVRKEKLLEPEFVKILEEQIQLSKDLEHGTKKELTGEELDRFISNADKYLKRINKLFKQIERTKEEERMVETYETLITVVRDVLKLEGLERVDDVEMEKAFEHHLVNTGRIPEKYLRIFSSVVKGKRHYDEKTLSKTEVEEVHKQSADFVRFMIEHIQRQRGRELERAKIRVKYGEKFGEVTLLDNVAYIVPELDRKDKEVLKADLTPEGG